MRGYPLIILICSIVSLFSCKSASLKVAEAKFAYGEYAEAFDIYKRAVGKIKSTDKQTKAAALIHQAISAEQIGQFAQAERSLQSVFRLKVDIPELYFHLARLQHRSGKYGEAKKNYLIYLKTDPKNQIALNGVLSCDSIPEWQKAKTRYQIKAMNQLNSRQFDFAPMLSPSGEELYFSSNRNKVTGNKKSNVTGYKHSDLFLSKQDARGNWSKPILVPGEVNGEWEEGVISFSADGKKMYLTQASPTGSAGSQIAISSLSGEAWSKPSVLNIVPDTMIYVGHPSLSPEGDQLFFVAKMRGGEGLNDIWCATLEEGKVVGIENLGPQINTMGNEIVPYCRAKDELYFASDGHPGFGGYDLFKALLVDGKWIVTNLGEPINSNADEMGITFAGLEEKGFLSSNRGQSKGTNNIYYFEMPMLKLFINGKVTDEIRRPMPKAKIHIVSNHGLNKKFETQGEKGTFQIRAERNTSYLIQASAGGFLNASTKLEIDNSEKDRTYNISLTLLPIAKPIEMENILYDLNQATLRPESHKALDQLILLLNDNPNITIELSAHTDRAGSDEHNDKLSNERAQSVVNYLIEKGINPQRLTPQGYGKNSPKVVDSFIAQQHNFLKEGDVLDEAFISKLRADLQAICDQINRRTEFRVLKVNFNLY